MRVCRLGFIVGLFFVAVVASAQTWNGTGANNNWTTIGNWIGGGPAHNGTANVHFGGSTRLSPNTDLPWSVNSITFEAGGNFVLGGSNLTIQGGGITNNNAGGETIGNSMVLGASQTWQGPSAIFLTGAT